MGQKLYHCAYCIFDTFNEKEYRDHMGWDRKATMSCPILLSIIANRKEKAK